MDDDQVTEHGVVDPQRALDLGNLAAVEVEHDEDVVTLAEPLDLVCQAALAPQRRLDDLAALGLDKRAHRFHGDAHRVILQLRPDDVHQLVVTPRAWPLLSSGLAAPGVLRLPRWSGSRDPGAGKRYVETLLNEKRSQCSRRRSEDR